MNPTMSLDLAQDVIAELIGLWGHEYADRLMLIGAHCRDYWHAALGRPELLRGTNDADLALTVVGAGEYSDLVKPLKATGTTGVRFYVNGIPTDIMPFGGIEDPVETSKPSGRKGGIDVFGFNEVFGRAISIETSDGSLLRLPTPAGYAALKVKAWVDRCARYEHKDGADLALVCSWYQEWPELFDQLYDDRLGTLGRELLEKYEFDDKLARVELLGRHVSETLGSSLAQQLVRA